MESNPNQQGQQRRTSSRQPKPTAEAIVEKINRLKAARSAACGKVTAKTNEIHSLGKSEGISASTFSKKADEWNQAMTNLTEIHNKYVDLLAPEERDYDAQVWAAPVFNGFSSAKNDIERCLQQLQLDEIRPSDSVSQISEHPPSNVSHSPSRVSRSSRRSSSSSTRSSVSQARAEAVARKAELLARAAALKQKQAHQERAKQLQQLQREKEMKRKEEELRLERQREQDEMERKEMEDMLRHEQAKIEVEEELAAADARLQALEELSNASSVSSNKEPVHNEEPPPSKQCVALPQQYEEDQLRATHYMPIKSEVTSLNPYANDFAPQAQGILHEQQPVKFGPQNLIEQLISQQIRNTLPPTTLQEYDGDPLQYAGFIRAFEYSVESKTQDPADRMYFLDQYTTGRAGNIVQGCMHMPPDRGYVEARKLLEKHFGNKYKVSEAILHKAENWSDIKNEDSKALKDFSLFLTESENMMIRLNYLQELNHTRSLRGLVAKLPYQLRLKWRSYTDNIQESLDREVTFHDLVKFVEQEARIATNPVYGNVRETKVQRKTPTKPTSERHLRLLLVSLTSQINLKINK